VSKRGVNRKPRDIDDASDLEPRATREIATVRVDAAKRDYNPELAPKFRTRGLDREEYGMSIYRMLLRSLPARCLVAQRG